jgi:hypothetical protein
MDSPGKMHRLILTLENMHGEDGGIPGHQKKREVLP